MHRKQENEIKFTKENEERERRCREELTEDNYALD